MMVVMKCAKYKDVESQATDLPIVGFVHEPTGKLITDRLNHRIQACCRHSLAAYSINFSHILVCALAISAVIKTDIAIVTGQFARKELEFTENMISRLLITLWVTGLAVIHIDTGFSPDILQAKPKLRTKLMCVSILSLNGMLWHHISFPILTKDSSAQYQPLMLAAFVGMTNLLVGCPSRISLLLMLYFYCLL